MGKRVTKTIDSWRSAFSTFTQWRVLSVVFLGFSRTSFLVGFFACIGLAGRWTGLSVGYRLFYSGGRRALLD